MQKNNVFNKFLFSLNFFLYRFVPNFKKNCVVLINHLSFVLKKDSLQLNRFQVSKMNKLLPNSAICL